MIHRKSPLHESIIDDVMLILELKIIYPNISVAVEREFITLKWAVADLDLY